MLNLDAALGEKVSDDEEEEEEEKARGVAIRRVIEVDGDVGEVSTKLSQRSLSSVRGLDVVEVLESNDGIETSEVARSQLEEDELQLQPLSRAQSQSQSQTQSQSETGLRAMISYCWANQEFALRTADFLRDHGVRCWIDVQSMSEGDDLYSAMADGVTNSDVILVLVSPDYRDSSNCRRELSCVCQVW